MRREAEGWTDDLRSRPRRGRARREGDRERRRELARGPARAERSEVPATTIVRPRRATTGAMVKSMKSAIEPSVWRTRPSLSTEMLPEPGHRSRVTGCAHVCEPAASWSRIGLQSAQPGEKPATYSTKGPTFEHGNPDPSARSAKPGKPPSSAMSRTGGGVSVVVGARESRVHGEGRQ